MARAQRICYSLSAGDKLQSIRRPAPGFVARNDVKPLAAAISPANIYFPKVNVYMCACEALRAADMGFGPHLSKHPWGPPCVREATVPCLIFEVITPLFWFIAKLFFTYGGPSIMLLGTMERPNPASLKYENEEDLIATLIVPAVIFCGGSGSGLMINLL